MDGYARKSNCKIRLAFALQDRYKIKRGLGARKSHPVGTDASRIIQLER